MYGVDWNLNEKHLVQHPVVWLHVLSRRKLQGFLIEISYCRTVDDVDGAEIRRSPPGMHKTLLDNGKTYQPQLVQDFWTINSIDQEKMLLLKSTLNWNITISVYLSIYILNSRILGVPGTCQMVLAHVCQEPVAGVSKIVPIKCVCLVPTMYLGGGFKYCLFSPRSLGKWSKLTNILQMGWNRHLGRYIHRMVKVSILNKLCSWQEAWRCCAKAEDNPYLFCKK